MKAFVIFLYIIAHSCFLYSQPTTVIFSDNIRGANDWGDYNNDGYLDFIITGLAGQYPNQYLKTALYLNSGGYFYEISNFPLAIDVSYQKGRIKWIDYNNDNNLDLFITGDTDITYNIVQVSKLYKNNGSGTFTEVTNLPFANKMGCAGWADFDNDGDFDLLLTSDTTCIYISEGNDLFTKLSDFPINMIANKPFALGDYNNDGYIDILAYVSGNNISVFKNNGNGSFIEQTTINFPLIDGTIEWGDSDNDGDLDIIMSGNRTSGSTISYLCVNNGSNSFSSIQLSAGYVGTSSWGDYDNDGKLDFIITGDFYDGDMGYGWETEFYKNYGSNNFQPDIQLFNEGGNEAQWVDYDTDGDLDISIAGHNGVVNIYNNNCPQINLSPNAPTNLTTVTNGSDLILQWNKPTDDHNPSSSLSYNVYFGTIDSLTKIISPMSDLSTGNRKLSGLGNAGMNNFYILKNLPDGQYVWGVQAIDHSFKGSLFSICDTIDFITSINKYTKSGLFSIYPNPSVKTITVDIQKPVNEKTNIEITDINGLLIYSDKLPQQQTKQNIDISGFSKGIYFVTVRSSSFIETRKLIIQ